MLNQIIVAGRMTKDPELRRTAAGVPVTSFTLACDRDKKSTEPGAPTCDFIECVAWNETAEIISRFMTKGRLCLMVGRMQCRKWTGRDGSQKRNWELLVERFYFLDKAENNAPESRYNGGKAFEPSAEFADFQPLEGEDADLPWGDELPD